LSHLPADVINVRLVQEFEHQLVVNHCKKVDERAHAEEDDGENSINERIHLIVNQLVTKSRLPVNWGQITSLGGRHFRKGFQLRAELPWLV
jgi:hypothetical protein